MTTAELCTLFNQVVGALVRDPAAVSVTAEPLEDGSVLIKARVAQGDMGKVIGKQGRTAQSLRVVLNAIGMEQGTRYLFDIDRAPESNEAVDFDRTMSSLE